MALMAASALAPLRAVPAAAQNAGDRGIGGTGLAPSGSGDDRGIGGTGFIGTIRRFGSIIVNDTRIAYPPQARVTIDGRIASTRELRLGQVVSVTAEPAPQGGLSTSQIAVSHEVVGEIRAISGPIVNVLNQRIDISLLGEIALRAGMRVAVSGLRRLDGVVVASLIDVARAGLDRISGLVETDEDGLWIDGLKLRGGNRAWVGERVVLAGRPTSSGFVISAGGIDRLPGARSVSRLSVETYLRREGTQLRLGSGLVIPDAGNGLADLDGDAKAVLELAIDRAGQLRLTAILPEGNSAAGASGSSGPGAPGSGVGGPGGFGGGPGGPGGGFGGPGGSAGAAGAGPGGAGPGGNGPGGNGPGGGGAPR